MLLEDIMLHSKTLVQLPAARAEALPIERRFDLNRADCMVVSGMKSPIAGLPVT